MGKQTLEQELKGFTYVNHLVSYEIWARGSKRILYDPEKKEVVLRYNMKKREKQK